MSSMLAQIVRKSFFAAQVITRQSPVSTKALPRAVPVLLTSSQRQFATSPNRAAIPPLLWLIAKPFTKLAAIIVGRGFRQWWTKLPEMKRSLFYAHLKRNRVRYAATTGGVVTTVGVYYALHIKETPITHRPRFIIFSTEQLTDIEKLEKDQIFVKYEKDILDMHSPYTNRALRVANRLFQANRDLPEVSAIRWKLTVVDADVVNAAAFPSGDLVVFTGLIDFVQSDDEMAIILAHEMSHAILQHAAEEVSHSRVFDIGTIALAMIVWAMLPSDLSAVITQLVAEKFLKFTFELPYSRQLEKEADTVGLMLAAKACFDVRSAALFWRRMNELNEEGGEVPEMLSTHPANETRALDLEELMPAALQLRKDCKCYDLPPATVTTKPALKMRDANTRDVVLLPGQRLAESHSRTTG